LSLVSFRVGPSENRAILPTHTTVFEIIPADNVHHVDFERPESHGNFFVTFVPEFNVGGRELIQCVRIMLTGMVDIRDFDEGKFEGRCVVGGRAVLMMEPCLPYYLLHEHGTIHEAVHDDEHRFEEVHKIHVTRILKGPKADMKTTLLVFPKGMIVSSDFTTTASLTDGQMLDDTVFPCAVTTTVMETSQVLHFFPCAWKVRVLQHEDDRSRLELTQERKVDRLKNALKGVAL
jgi:hypothetical protein